MNIFEKLGAWLCVATFCLIAVAHSTSIGTTGAGKGGGTGPSNVVVASVATRQTSTAGTFTYTAQGTGSPSSDRITVLGIWAKGDGVNACSIINVTIGGNTAALARPIQTTTPTNGCLAIYGLFNPTGTTATIVFSANAGNFLRTALVVWSLSGTGGVFNALNNNATNSASTNPISLTMNVAAKSAAVGISGDFSTNSRTSTWAGLTSKDMDVQPGTNAASAASGNYVSAITPLTISDTFSGTVLQPILATANF